MKRISFSQDLFEELCYLSNKSKKVAISFWHKKVFKRFSYQNIQCQSRLKEKENLIWYSNEKEEEIEPSPMILFLFYVKSKENDYV